MAPCQGRPKIVIQTSSAYILLGYLEILRQIVLPPQRNLPQMTLPLSRCQTLPVAAVVCTVKHSSVLLNLNILPALLSDLNRLPNQYAHIFNVLVCFQTFILLQ
ncbi:hypothetical protein NG271_220 [Saccharomyces cerevisiae synthetic construct]|uniref:Putative uncharacterized protein YDL032w n=2 Tax=Saccharomyces cerevisiae TaxID=4932 RepID=YD032_YEAST|nr:RecName: Full=Putative uncharacterized protein YDL032w [Saccharomyces cerevisiae S288C]AAT93303.1 YDL032W [Saccharomyces cerevisiae]WNF19777.1 hypothetical protein NG271_220 [Saccharomyces cerevisiae synthetic construct]CAY78475.1 EC1118_1D0_2003p [Saccharomyces cerevisiae EC1118]KZV12198.1 hypothetical protein WN66_01015 [Saccharomyces cerevisiae]CAA96457.1 unknown [Saccharomyces cerevisiae]